MKIQLFAFLLTILFSCSNSTTPINDLENLVDKIDDPNFSLTEDNVEDIVAEYAEIEDELAQYEYTDEELREIGRLQGKYVAKMAKIGLKNFKKYMEVFSKQLEGGLEGFMEELENGDFDEE